MTQVRGLRLLTRLLQMRTRWLGVLVALFLMASARLPADAHAILVESQPAIGATIDGGDIALRLRFNSRIDRGRSRLTLLQTDHAAIVLPIDARGTDDIILSKAVLQPGAYIVRWQVLAIDGHITRGDVAFTVGVK